MIFFCALFMALALVLFGLTAATIQTMLEFGPDILGVVLALFFLLAGVGASIGAFQVFVSLP